MMGYAISTVLAVLGIVGFLYIRAGVRRERTWVNRRLPNDSGEPSLDTEWRA